MQVVIVFVFTWKTACYLLAMSALLYWMYYHPCPKMAKHRLTFVIKHSSQILVKTFTGSTSRINRKVGGVFSIVILYVIVI